MGIEGKAKVLGKVEMRSGMGRVNGIVKYTVVDSPAVPPLPPASLLKQVGAVIDFEQQHDGSQENWDDDHFESLAEWTCGSQAD